MYVEYVFLDNFLFDGALLICAAAFSKIPIRLWRICLSSLLGAAFAIIYPFILLPTFFNGVLKIAVGLILPLLLQPKLHGKRAWKKYAITAFYFLALSTAVGGALIGLAGWKTLPKWCVWLGLFAIATVAFFGVKAGEKRRSFKRFTYPCIAYFSDREIRAEGYFDSGNRAQKNGLPVCFVSPDFLYDLFGWEYLNTRGHVRDEMQIMTVSGRKNISLYEAEIEIAKDKQRFKKRVYFSPTANMLTREYKILLNARIFEE